MNKKQALIICIVVSALFSPYFLLPDISGVDSYYFLNEIFDKPVSWTFETDPAADFIIHLIPANFIVIKLILLGLLIASSLIMSLTGDLINKNKGWLAGLFCFMSFAWLQFFLRLENDVFAYPLILLSLYFIVRAKKTKNPYWGVASLLTLGLACLFWKASALMFLSHALIWLPGIVAAIGLIAWKWETLIGFFWFGSQYVSEDTPIFGITYNVLLLIGLLGLPTFLIAPTALFAVIAFFHAKYAFFLVPFLALGIINVKLKPLAKKYDGLKIFLVLLLIFNVLLYSNILPNSEVMDTISVGVQKAEELNKPLMNDWGYGYWVAWQGGTASEWGSGFNIPKEPEEYAGHVVITAFNLTKCDLIEEKGFLRRIRVYDC